MLFPRGDNYKIVKNTLTKFLKNIFFRPTEPISTNIGTKHPWVRGIQVSTNEKTINCYKVNNIFFILFIDVMI